MLLSYSVLGSACFDLAHPAGPGEPGREDRAHQGRLPFLDGLLLPLCLAVVLLPPPPGFGLHTIAFKTQEKGHESMNVEHY